MGFFSRKKNKSNERQGTKTFEDVLDEMADRIFEEQAKEKGITKEECIALNKKNSQREKENYYNHLSNIYDHLSLGQLKNVWSLLKKYEAEWNNVNRKNFDKVIKIEDELLYLLNYPKWLVGESYDNSPFLIELDIIYVEKLLRTRGH